MSTDDRQRGSDHGRTLAYAYAVAAASTVASTAIHHRSRRVRSAVVTVTWLSSRYRAAARARNLAQHWQAQHLLDFVTRADGGVDVVEQERQRNADQQADQGAQTDLADQPGDGIGAVRIGRRDHHHLCVVRRQCLQVTAQAWRIT